MRKTELRRSTPLKRGGPVKRRGARLKPRNSARRKKNHARAYGGEARIRWVQLQPCAVCGWTGGSENAHIGTGGVGRKADYTRIVPLCGPRPGRPSEATIGVGGFDAGCHAHLHSLGKRLFEKAYYVDLDALAAETESRWQLHASERSECVPPKEQSAHEMESK